MLEMLIIIFFIELIVILGAYLFDLVSEKVKLKLLSREQDKLTEDYENQIFAPLEESEDFDDGYIEEMKTYDERIAQIKFNLDIQPEVITDEQERELER